MLTRVHGRLCPTGSEDVRTNFWRSHLDPLRPDSELKAWSKSARDSGRRILCSHWHRRPAVHPIGAETKVRIDFGEEGGHGCLSAHGAAGGSDRKSATTSQVFRTRLSRRTTPRQKIGVTYKPVVEGPVCCKITRDGSLSSVTIRNFRDPMAASVAVPVETLFSGPTV